MIFVLEYDTRNVLDLEVDQLKCTKKIEIQKSQLTHGPKKMRFGRAGDLR